jgi:hypothetical protein
MTAWGPPVSDTEEREVGCSGCCWAGLGQNALRCAVERVRPARLAQKVSFLFFSLIPFYFLFVLYLIQNNSKQVQTIWENFPEN